MSKQGAGAVAHEAYVPPELATSAGELLLAFGSWCDRHQELVLDDDWSYRQLVDAFLMECGANDARVEVEPAEEVHATRAVLLLYDRRGRTWTAGALIAPAETTGAAALPLASEEAKQLDLQLRTFKVVEE